MTNGLKQGCPLSPILFNLTLDPLISKLDTLDDLDLRAYCDDIAMGFTSHFPVCQALTEITNFNRATGMTSNTDKTKYITALFFRSPLSLDLPDEWQLVKEAKSYKYLGLLMGNTIDINDVFMEAWRKLSRRVASYMPYKNYYNTQTPSHHLKFIPITHLLLPLPLLPNGRALPNGSRGPPHEVARPGLTVQIRPPLGPH